MRTLIPFIFSTLFAQVCFAQVVYPDNIFPDTIHAPFDLGIASGDPTPNAVIIWTHLSVDSSDFSNSYSVDWQVATDSAMTNVVQNGSFATDSSRDFTVKIDVTGLQPDTRYWYQFTQGGNSSAVGRTLTAPVGQVDALSFAMASCSSVYSGWFNAYRQIGRRNDIDLVIHVGDYIYDFVDEDEEIRVPEPYPQRPENRSDWRGIHAYYHHDPDFRLALERHPWVILWDNHDVERTDYADSAGATQAFWEWTTARRPDSSNQNIVYRTYTHGDLMQLTILDQLRFREGDSIPAPDREILGTPQNNWLKSVLDTTTATWKIHGNQKQMAGFQVPTIPFVDLQALTEGSWDGYDPARDRLLNYITDNNINNFVMLSGDIHMTFVSDLTPNPNGSNYDGETGEGAAGVEFLPTSVSRGNLDELLGSDALAGTFESLSLGLNPHTLFFNSTDHGYGIVRLTPDSLVGEVWYCPIREKTDQQQLGARFVMLEGENHWKRETTSVIGEQRGNTLQRAELHLIPNPTAQNVTIGIKAERSQSARIEIVEMATGKTVFTQNGIQLTADQFYAETLNLEREGISSGVYLVWTQGEDFREWRKLVVR